MGKIRAVHLTWGALFGGIGTLFIAISASINTGHIDFNAIGASLLVIFGSFTPAAQLVLPMFVQPQHKGDMPKLVEVAPVIPPTAEEKK